MLRQEIDLEKIVDSFVQINDRFSFDKIFKYLLREGYDHEEAKDFMVYSCNLGLIPLHGRIVNKSYRKISSNPDVMSRDLRKLYITAYKQKFHTGDDIRNKLNELVKAKGKSTVRSFKNSE